MESKIIKKITVLEWLIMLISFLILPLHFIIMKYLINSSSWLNINYINIISNVISVMFIVFTLGQILFKRPYVTFLFSCHQNPERSLKYLGKYLGICARCTGILIGIFIMPFITIINFNYLYLLLGLIPLIADGSFQQFTKYKSNNLKRIITGILFGFGMIVFISYYYLVIAKIIIYFI